VNTIATPRPAAIPTAVIAKSTGIDQDHADRRADHHDGAGHRLEQAGGDDRAQQIWQ